MPNYEEAGVKLIHTQLNKLKYAAKYKTGTTLKITNKKSQDKELPHELFLTTREKKENKKCLHKQHVDRYKT